MPLQFLHGVEVIDIDDGARTVQTLKSSVIGIVGTAPDAVAEDFPYNKPVLIAGSLKEAAKLGVSGTLPAALKGIFDQAGATVVVVRIEVGVASAEGVTPVVTDEDATMAHIIGGVDEETGEYTGLSALLAASSVVKQEPRLIVAPGFSHREAVATAMVTVAERLKAIAVVDGPNTTDTAAMDFREKIGSKRVYIVDPWVKVFNTETSTENIEPASARVAGMIVKSDMERGFWWSPSNLTMNGIIGTARPVDFKLGDINCRANMLNEKQVTTIIQESGYRLWGNRTTSSDPKWAFLNVVRTADMINDSLQRAHMWAIDRNITKTYIESVTESVNNYLRSLMFQGAIIGGKCWADPDLNSPDQIAAGKVYFDFDFTPPTPAEHITFRSRLVNDYFESIFE